VLLPDSQHHCDAFAQQPSLVFGDCHGAQVEVWQDLLCLASALVGPFHDRIGRYYIRVGVGFDREELGSAEFDVWVCIVGEGGRRDDDARWSGHAVGVVVVPVRVGQSWLHLFVLVCVHCRGGRGVGWAGVLVGEVHDGEEIVEVHVNTAVDPGE